MIVRPQQHWLCCIFVWHGSVLSKISSRLLLNFLFSIAVIFMPPWYTHLGIKFTLAPFSILGVAIAIFLGFRIMPGTPVTLKRENFGAVDDCLTVVTARGKRHCRIRQV
ncbi:bestrophin family ion channel [Escherichia coli]